MAALPGSAVAEAPAVLMLVREGVPIPVTDQNRDLLAGLTQQDIVSRSAAWRLAAETERERLACLVTAADVPHMTADGVADLDDVQRLARAIDVAYTEHEVTLMAAAGTPESVNCRAALAEVYGTADRAVVTLGQQVEKRAEVHAGITTNQVHTAWERRMVVAHNDFIDSIEEEGPLSFWDQTRVIQALRNGTDPDSKKDLARLADGYRAALAEVRPMGGHLDLHADSSKPSQKALRDAALLFPADWVAASNSHESPLWAGSLIQRAHYAHRSRIEKRVKAPKVEYVHTADDECPDAGMAEIRRRGAFVQVWRTYTEADMDEARAAGYKVGDRPIWERRDHEVTTAHARWDGESAGWHRVGQTRDGDSVWARPMIASTTVPGDAVSEIRLSKAKTPLPGQDERFPAAAHELAHRMQHVVPTLSAIEKDWRARRTTNEEGMREEKIRLYGPRSSEVAWKDEFADAYIGKDYGGRPSTEVLSVGMESLFAGQNGGLLVGAEKNDPDNRGLILGALAAAGRAGS